PPRARRSRRWRGRRRRHLQLLGDCRCSWRRRPRRGGPRRGRRAQPQPGRPQRPPHPPAPGVEVAVARPELVVEFRPGASPLYDPIGYIDLPGASGAYASTPDRTGLDITGDLDVRAEVTLTDWAPAADSAIAAKWVASGNQRSWRFYLTTDGTLGLEWSSAGTSGTVLSAESTVPVDPPEDGHLAVRAMIDVNVLSAGREIHFYTARGVDGPWIQLGAPV